MTTRLGAGEAQDRLTQALIQKYGKLQTFCTEAALALLLELANP
jgi:hypothetical protein